LVVLQAASEARYLLARGALEAKAAVALAIGYWRDYTTSRVIGSGAGISRKATTFLRVFREAEGANHIAIALALLVNRTDIAVAGGTRVAKLQTYTVTVLYIALAIGDSVINEATRLGAERVRLILADHEGRLRIR